MGAADDLSLRLLLTEQVVAELFGDLSPQWTVAQIADLPQSLVDEHFVGYWEAEGGPHPLEDLPTFS